MLGFLTTTYLVPAIVLNPSFIIHFLNTVYSHLAPPANSVSHSPYPWFEKLGPVPGSTLFFDVYNHEKLVWVFSVVMAFVQIVAFEWVKENREQVELARKANVGKQIDSKDGNETVDGSFGNAYWRVIAFLLSCGAISAVCKSVLEIG
jgi:hypothetical protein